MTDGLLSWCLGFCRLEASWLTEAVKRCSTYYGLLLKSPGISKVLLHCHTVEPVQNAVICNVPGHLHSSCIGFMITVHELWQISYNSATKQRTIIRISRFDWMDVFFLFSGGIPWVVCGLSLTLHLTSLFFKNVNIWETQTCSINQTDSHLSTGQCGTLEYLCLSLSLSCSVSFCPYSSITDEPELHKHGMDGCHLPVLELH